jgi:putative FmdB family regulatory protein
MPTYEYQCKSCNHRFEIWQKMTDEPLTTCPECQGSIRRVLFPAGVVFKGAGFYKTDYANGSRAAGENGQKSKTEEGAKEGAAAESGGSGENKTSESKPAENKTAAA